MTRNDEVTHVERVQGIGGFAFPASDPDMRSLWYATQLGMAAPPSADGDEEWMQDAGQTVFVPCGPARADCPHLGRAGWASIREPCSDRRFSQVIDLEDIAVQPWQPVGAAEV